MKIPRYRPICMAMFVALLGSWSIPLQAQTAVNFECNDCAGTKHNLFEQLDAGKVVVITWVMPCGTCLGPAITASTAVSDYENSNPDKVIFYLVDDYANTSCTSLRGWAKNNGIEYHAAFSDGSITMDDYGIHGMPKTVVISGQDRKVVFNQNDDITLTQVKDAIQQAIWLSTGIEPDAGKPRADFILYPNPVQNVIHLELLNTWEGIGSVSILNMSGSVLFETKPIVQEIMRIDVATLQPGMYLFRLNLGDAIITRKIYVIR